MSDMLTNPKTAKLVTAILDKIEAEINDKRTFIDERTGLRIAHTIVRDVAASMGILSQ